MKTLLVVLLILLAGDFSLFSGHYTQQTWVATRTYLKSIQTYADEATASLTSPKP